MFSLALCRVFFSAYVYIITPPAYFTVPEKSGFPKKACSDVSRFIFFRIFTSHPSPTAVVMGATLAQIFFKPEKILEFFRLKICARDDHPGKLE